MKFLRIYVSAAALWLVCSFCAAAELADIRLKTFDHENVSLSEVIQSDKLTLVMIWATQCPPCEEQKPMVQQFHSDYHGTKANVIGVVIDGFNDIDEVNRLIDEQQPTYDNYIADPTTFLSDFELTTGKQFTGAPSYIMFNDKGDAIAVAIGPVTRAQLEGAIAQ